MLVRLRVAVRPKHHLTAGQLGPVRPVHRLTPTGPRYADQVWQSFRSRIAAFLALGDQNRCIRAIGQAIQTVERARRGKRNPAPGALARDLVPAPRQRQHFLAAIAGDESIDVAQHLPGLVAIAPLCLRDAPHQVRLRRMLRIRRDRRHRDPSRTPVRLLILRSHGRRRTASTARRLLPVCLHRDPQPLAQLARRRDLVTPGEQVSVKRHQIAAPVICGEVRPNARSDRHRERPRATIRPRGIDRFPLVALALATGQPLCEQAFGNIQRRAGNGGEVDHRMIKPTLPAPY